SERRHLVARPRLFQRTRPPHPASIPITVPRSSLPLGPERANPTAVQMRLRGVPTRPRSSRPTRQVGLPSQAEERSALLPIHSLSRPSAPSRPRVQSDVQRGDSK
ncbi:hypothetical protein EV363DRAFT_1188000, partial [Boletus edulis]